MLPGPPHSGSFSHRRQNERGAGRCPGRRITPDGTGGSRTAAEKVALVRTEAQGESHPSAEVPAAGSAPLQPANRSGLSPQRRLSAVLGIPLAHLGRNVPGFLVPSNHALPDRADEENRPDAAGAPRTADQLFKGEKRNSPAALSRASTTKPK